MMTQERDIQCLRGILRPILTFGVVSLASCLLRAPGWPSRDRSSDCLTGNARAIRTQVRQRNARFSDIGAVMIRLLNQKIKRIDARLACSHDPQERSRLLEMRQRLKGRMAHVGPAVQRMFGSGAAAKGKPTPTAAGPTPSTRGGMGR
jgi:hypothetical protein